MAFTDPQVGVSLESARRRLSLIPALAALFIVVSVAQWAHAAPITIVGGGFTAFNGLSGGDDGAGGAAPGCDAGIQGYVGGSLLQASSCAATFFGPASVTFGSTLSSLEFYGRQFVSCDPTGGPCDPYADLPHNNFTFTKWTTTTQDVTDPTKQAFVLGTLSFTNGTWFGSGKVNSVHLEITASSTDPLFGTQTLSDDLVLDIRLGSTPEDNADCFSFARFASMGTVCAYEPNVPGKSNTTSVLLWGMQGSLIPTAFTDVQGGFLVADASAVPEPASLVLLGTGLAALAARRRRKS